MFKDGFSKITDMDASPLVVKQMKQYYLDHDIAIPYEHCDLKKMTNFKDAQFDAVIDKGTLDCILCGDRSQKNVKFALGEIYRVLKPGGVYVCVSYGTREQREDYFNRLDWHLVVHRIAKTTIEKASVVQKEIREQTNFTWVYVMTKDKNAQ